MATPMAHQSDSLLTRTGGALFAFKSRSKSRRLARKLLAMDDRLLEDLGLERAHLTDFV